MTNQEAISHLKTWRITGDRSHEAFNMAISALEKQILNDYFEEVRKHTDVYNEIKTKSDLIERQAAFDILDAYQVMVENGEENPYAWARLRISELPSAQPEIIRCKDCKYYVKDHGWNCIEYTVCSISPLHHPLRKPNDFCSKAERREDK